MKRVKKELRTISTQERMTSLSLLCIEQDLVQQLKFDDVIEDFAQAKAKKSTTRPTLVSRVY
jgi:hypothetical protein